MAKRKASPTRKATESVRSAHGGAVAAERSRLAAKARSAAPGLAVQGFNTTGLGATGKVTGTVRYARIVIETGGELAGTVEVIPGPPEPEPATRTIPHAPARTSEPTSS